MTLFALLCMLTAFVGVVYSADEEDEAATDTAALDMALLGQGRVAPTELRYAARITDAPRRQLLY